MSQHMQFVTSAFNEYMDQDGHRISEDKYTRLFIIKTDEERGL